MDPEQIIAMRDLVDHLNAALAIADGLSQTLLAALLCECLDNAQRVLGAAISDRG
ncbi:hypothetical protein [Sphingomonas sp. CROZ-RG-20F-R02-07]|uniref:hypothetical protein n=1 Tax=Sphingomonas sp. CROZ-RG-20F-R02-07 TaxID=2914832 RepID=UPI001F596B1C|nr:hypothetical protein [Sphingomonas sp. CROZ-RG-20F-R02-07]